MNELLLALTIFMSDGSFFYYYNPNVKTEEECHIRAMNMAAVAYEQDHAAMVKWTCDGVNYVTPKYVPEGEPDA